MKKYKWEQEQIANMKDYIARFGHGSAKLARQAQVQPTIVQPLLAMWWSTPGFSPSVWTSSAACSFRRWLLVPG